MWLGPISVAASVHPVEQQSSVASQLRVRARPSCGLFLIYRSLPCSPPTWTLTSLATSLPGSFPCLSLSIIP